jgi:hypothetical protein
MSHTISSKLPAIHGGRPAFAERFPFIRPHLPPLQNVVAGYESVYQSGLLTNSKLSPALPSSRPATPRAGTI